jgi:hypothetical protein
MKDFLSCEIVSSESSKPGKNGKTDICHKDLIKISEEKAEEFANKFCKPPNVYICIEGEEKQISPEQFVRLREWAREMGIM